MVMYSYDLYDTLRDAKVSFSIKPAAAKTGGGAVVIEFRKEIPLPFLKKGEFSSLCHREAGRNFKK